MEDPVVEDHIKFEAEEAHQMTDHVWEEVVIDDTVVPTWKQDVKDEDGCPVSNDVFERATQDSDVNNLIPEDSETDITDAMTIPQSSPLRVITSASSVRVISNPANTPPMPVVTSVTSLAPQQQIVNLNQLKLLPEGSFVSIGNKRMKLVSYNGDKKLIAGKVVTVTGANNKVITGKVVSLGNKSKIIPNIAKVVTVPNSANSTPNANIVNKVIPAKVVSIANPRLKPNSAKDKEVTIYITGLAGDKVQIRDPSSQEYIEEEKEVLDDLDTALPPPLAGEEWMGGTEVTEGHFLLHNSIEQEKAFTCTTCERQFSQLKYLLSHQQTHLLSEPVSCEICDKRFKRRYDLLRHKRKAHAEDLVYECDICRKTFTDLEEANKHRLTHTEEFKYCCEVCSRPFRLVHDLKRHRSIHFDEKPYDCEVCGKKFKHKSNLKTHQATHYSEKPFSCTLCDKRFHQKGNLKTHLIVHTGEMPFVCDICTKRFHTRSGLLNHSYSHSDEKPFQCDICDKTFNWKSGLLTHQQTHRRTATAIDPQILSEEVEVIEIGPIPVDN